MTSNVLLADIGGGPVAGMLGVIEACDLRLGISDLTWRRQLDRERRAEQREHGAERREDP